MAIDYEDEIVAGTVLIRQLIQSQNYAAGSTGWEIAADGSAEFNNVTVRGTFQGSNYIINSSGAFFYSGTPANGNMIASIAPAAGTDSFGNQYLAGMTSYGAPFGSELFASVSGGRVLLGAVPGGAGTAPDTAHASELRGNNISTSLTSNSSVAKPDSSIVQAYPGVENAATGSGNNPIVIISDEFTDTPVDLGISGTLIKYGNDGGTAMTWQDPTSLLGTGWAIGPNSGTLQALRYRKDALDNLVFAGTVHSTSTTPATTLFTLPSGYRPKVTQRVVCVSNASGTPTVRMVEINSNGGVLIENNLTTASTDVYLNFSIPLGNIA